jgi:uncharacterized protein (TIGR03084 family)
VGDDPRRGTGLTLLETVLDDLAAESAGLESVVVGLAEEAWRTPTPAAGWDVATQIAHLAWTDEAAYAAATDKRRWEELLLETLADPEHVVDRAALTGGIAAPRALLERWRVARARLAETLLDHPAGQPVPWFGASMSATSMATARLMETWAHGLDVRDALGVQREVTDRIRHVAHLGVRTRDWAFALHRTPPPADEFRVELTAPSGDLWSWGPYDAMQTVTGPAYDFCLLVTQRTHRADTSLVATGHDAELWLDIAQAFAGLAGRGRDPHAG